MAPPPAASLTDFLLRLAVGPSSPDARNSVSIEGLEVGTGPDGALAIRIARMDAAMLRIGAGPLTLEAGRLVLHDVVASIRRGASGPRLAEARAARAELSDVKLDAPAAAQTQSAAQAASDAWCLAPLATAEGTIEAEIVDAKLLFDAQVRVTIRAGRIDFNEATVEHVGPDSRMGISRLGLYVDAPNGRSYLYQFASPVIAGVEYERRGALPGPWGARRGSVQLQPFGEALLRQGRAGHGHGITEQARQLFDRTAVSGHVQLGDGTFDAHGLQAVLAGRDQGHNLVRLHAQAVGRGLNLAIASLRIGSGRWQDGQARVTCGEATGELLIRLTADGSGLRAGMDLKTLAVSDLRLQQA